MKTPMILFSPGEPWLHNVWCCSPLFCEPTMQVDSFNFGPMLVRPRKWRRQEFHDSSTKHDELRMVVESYHIRTEACKRGKVLDISLPRFKLSIVLHSASVEKISGPGLVQAGASDERGWNCLKDSCWMCFWQDQRPYISIRINDKLKATHGNPKWCTDVYNTYVCAECPLSRGSQSVEQLASSLKLVVRKSIRNFAQLSWILFIGISAANSSFV